MAGGRPPSVTDLSSLEDERTKADEPPPGLDFQGEATVVIAEPEPEESAPTTAMSVAVVPPRRVSAQPPREPSFAPNPRPVGGDRGRVLSMLRGESIFRTLPKDFLGGLVDDLQIRTLAEGEVLVRAGDPPGPMFVVLTGALRVESTMTSGQPFVDVSGVGTALALRGALSDGPQRDNISASVASDVLLFPRELVQRLQATAPPFADLLSHLLQQDERFRGTPPTEAKEVPAQVAPSGAPRRIAMGLAALVAMVLAVLMARWLMRSMS